MSETLLASRDFFLALFKEANTTEANIPIIAITTSNSMRVKPAFFFKVLICLIDFIKTTFKNKSLLIIQLYSKATFYMRPFVDIFKLYGSGNVIDGQENSGH